MTLPDNHQQQLRAQGILKENEVIAKEGDLYVATDVLTGARPVSYTHLTLPTKRIV